MRKIRGPPEGLIWMQTSCTSPKRGPRLLFLLVELGVLVSSNNLEALSVHNAWATLVVLVLRDPHFLERRQRRQNGPSNPDRVLSLRGCNNLDLHSRWRKCEDLLLQTGVDSLEHRRASGQDGVGVQVTADIDVALHDGVGRQLVDSARLLSDQGGVEHRLAASDSLDSNGDHLAVWELVVLLEGVVGLGSLALRFKVLGAHAQLLLDISHDFTLGGGREGVSTLGQDLHQVVREVTAGKIQTQDSVRQGISLIDGDSVRHTITGIHNNTSGTSGSVKRQDGLDGYIHSRGREGLEHDLRHLLTVGLGVEWGLGEENGVFLGSNTELVVEGVVPDLLHIIPRGHDSVLNGVFKEEDTSLGLGLITDIGILLGHADHNTLMLGASHDGWEHGSRSVVTGKAGFDHSRSVVN